MLIFIYQVYHRMFTMYNKHICSFDTCQEAAEIVLTVILYNKIYIYKYRPLNSGNRVSQQKGIRFNRWSNLPHVITYD